MTLAGALRKGVEITRLCKKKGITNLGDLQVLPTRSEI